MVAQCIINAFEMVDIRHDHAQRRLAAVNVLKFTIQDFQNGPVVVHARQSVPLGLIAHALASVQKLPLEFNNPTTYTQPGFQFISVERLD